MGGLRDRVLIDTADLFHPVIRRCRFREVRSLRGGGGPHGRRRAHARVRSAPSEREAHPSLGAVGSWSPRRPGDCVGSDLHMGSGVGCPGVRGQRCLGALLLVAIGAIVGASGSRLVQYGIVGAAFATAAALIPVHSMVEAQLRPVRLALAGDTGIGDVLPRSRPSFAAWSNVLLLATAFSFTVGGAMLATVFHQASEAPVLWAVIGCGGTLSSPCRSPSRPHSHRPCDPFAIWLKAPSVLRQVITANACRWFRTMTSARCQLRSTGCRRVWLSDNGFKPRSGPTSTPPSPQGCSNKVTTCSPVSAAR